MFVPQDESFTLNGRRYIVKKQPQKMWPCQNCELADICAFAYADPNFPSCRKEDRNDNTNVVFHEELRKRVQRPSRPRNTGVRYE